jgi:hypothetical protein
LPQFNWQILGPLVLAAIAAAAGVVFLSSHLPRVSTQPASAAVRTTPAAQPYANLHTGPRLPGHVVGTPHLRINPSSTSSILRDLQAGELVEASACSSTCGWFLVGPPGQPAAGWVPSAFIALQGDEQKLVVIK